MASLSDGQMKCDIWVFTLLVLVYLSVHIAYAKKSFYRGANAIFGKIGRLASEEVVLQLIKSKCIPILLYGL